MGVFDTFFGLGVAGQYGGCNVTIADSEGKAVTSFSSKTKVSVSTYEQIVFSNGSKEVGRILAADVAHLDVICEDQFQITCVATLKSGSKEGFILYKTTRDGKFSEVMMKAVCGVVAAMSMNN